MLTFVPASSGPLFAIWIVKVTSSPAPAPDEPGNTNFTSKRSDDLVTLAPMAGGALTSCATPPAPASTDPMSRAGKSPWNHRTARDFMTTSLLEWARGSRPVLGRVGQTRPARRWFWRAIPGLTRAPLLSVSARRGGKRPWPAPAGAGGTLRAAHG